MMSRQQKDQGIARQATLKKAIQAAKRRNANRISNYVHLIPAFHAVVGGLSQAELRDAMSGYWAAIVYASSVDEQMRYICLAIVAHAVWMRGVHTDWRNYLPSALKGQARSAGCRAKYYVEDMRVFCDAAIAHTWAEVAQ